MPPGPRNPPRRTPKVAQCHLKPHSCSPIAPWRLETPTIPPTYPNSSTALPPFPPGTRWPQNAPGTPRTQPGTPTSARNPPIPAPATTLPHGDVRGQRSEVTWGDRSRRHAARRAPGMGSRGAERGTARTRGAEMASPRGGSGVRAVRRHGNRGGRGGVVAMATAGPGPGSHGPR